MNSTPGRALARAAMILLPLVAASLGLAAPWSILWGGLAWTGFLIAVLAGWGSLVERFTRHPGDLGLRLAWGTAALLAAAGPLLALGVLDRNALFALVAIGYLGYGWRHATEATPALVDCGRILAAARRDPHVALVWTALAALALLNIADACVDERANVYDDDVAYTPLVKRLLDVGNLDEPFSFRRISAFGGQTVLSALAAIRGTLANLYLVDHGIFHLITLALVIGMIRRHQVDAFVGGLLVLVLELMPDASINTGSYWSGVALFLALYRTVAEADDAPRPAFLIAGLIAAALCSLRQNYIPVAVGFLGLTLVLRLERPLAEAWRRERRVWLAALIGGVVIFAPYALASWRSNHTFLYPFQLGTFNPNIQMTPTVWSPWQELQFFLKVMLESDPIRVVVPLVPVLLLCRDRRPGRPLIAFAIASTVGFILLVHTFTLSDPPNLWRYAFGFATTILVILAIEGAGRGLAPDGPEDEAPAKPALGLPLIGRVMVIACLIGQLAATVKPITRRLSTVGSRLAAGGRTQTRAETELALPALYRDLQASVPRGATIAVLLDQPAYLDFARNPIINLDIPGYASYRPGMPFFRGPEPVADYFRDHEIRYVAFVRGTHSRYFFRRDFWLARVMWDIEIWQIMGAYVIDCIDNFAELADRYAKRFERDGLVVIDLGAPVGVR